MGRFSEPDFAFKFRDVIRQIVKGEIASAVPKAAYGSVQVIDRAHDTASVLIQGDHNPVNVRMGAVQPSAVGQIVRIEGSASDRYIADIVGGRMIANEPAGSLKMYAGSTSPDGYLLCNGAAISRTIYRDLFAVIGIAFGVGDGTNTFNLPNMQNRFPIGAGSTAALGAAGGTVQHQHTFDDGGHIHSASSNMLAHVMVNPSGQVVVDTSGTVGFTPNFSQTSTLARGSGGAAVSTGTVVAGDTTNTHASGTTALVNHLPSYLGVNYIIKT